MLIKKAADLRESDVTSKELYLRRREFIAGAGTAMVAAAAGAAIGSAVLAEPAAAQNPNAFKFPNGDRDAERSRCDLHIDSDSNFESHRDRVVNPHSLPHTPRARSAVMVVLVCPALDRNGNYRGKRRVQRPPSRRSGWDD